MSSTRAERQGPHQADTFIREILSRDRVSKPGDRQIILARVASVPFNTSRRRLSRPLAELVNRNHHRIPERSTELTHHWAKHVLGDAQWSPSTTEHEYFEDLRRTVQQPDAELLLRFAAHDHPVAIVVGRTRDVVPRERQGWRVGEALVVVYSARIGRIISGYMVKTSELTSVRSGTIWLQE